MYRALVGLMLVAVGMVLLSVFENALLGLSDDIASIQGSWPGWLGEVLHVVVGVTSVIVIVATNALLLVRRRIRRWMMINVAAISAIALGEAAGWLVLTYATSDDLRLAVEATSRGAFGNTSWPH